MCWSKDHILSTPIFIRIMCRDKFECIWKMLYFTDSSSEDQDDTLKKLRGFLENLGNYFWYNYTRDQSYSVDEYLSFLKNGWSFESIAFGYCMYKRTFNQLLQPKLLRSKRNSAEVSHPMCNCLLAPYSRKLKYCSYRDPFEYSLAFKTAIKAKSARPFDFITSTLLSQDEYNSIYSIFAQINKKFKIQKYLLNLFKRQVIEKKNLQLNVPELWKSSGDWLGYILSIW